MKRYLVLLLILISLVFSLQAKKMRLRENTNKVLTQFTKKANDTSAEDLDETSKPSNSTDDAGTTENLNSERENNSTSDPEPNTTTAPTNSLASNSADTNILIINKIVDGPFQIVSKSNGKCITSAGEGETLGLSYCSFSSEESNWFKIQYQPGVYMYMNQKSHLVMEVDCSSSSNGASVREWAKQDKTNQKWKIEKSGKYIKFQTLLERGRCLTVSSNGMRVYQWDCSSNDDQTWLIRVPSFHFSTSKMMIKSNASNLCMKSLGARTKLVQAVCDPNDDKQAFTFYENADKSFFVFVYDNLVLDNFNSEISNGNPIYTMDIANTDNQKWYLVPISDSKFVSLLNKQSAKCLDVPGGQKDEGIPMQQRDCSNDEAQSFTLMESNVIKIPKGDTYIHLNYSNKCLSFFPKQLAVQNECVFGSGLQAWRLNINDDGSYFIRNVYTSHILTWINYNEVEVSSTFTGEDEQRWWVYTVDSQNAKIRNKKTGRCLAIRNGSVDNGLNLGMFECSANNIYQHFSFKNFDYLPVPDSDRQYFQIINKGTNKCVRMRNIFSQLQQFDCEDDDMSLVWRAEKNPEKSFSIISLSGFVMDDYTFGAGNGNPIVGWEPNGGNSQKWFLIPMNQDYYAIVHATHAKCLDLTGGSTANGASMQLWDCQNNLNQNFILKKVNVMSIPTSFVQIKNSKHSKCLNINTIYKTPFQMPCSEESVYTQAFRMEANQDSSYYIRAYGGLIVDLSNPEAAWDNGLEMLMMPLYDMALSQKWYILPEGSHFRLVNYYSRKCFNLVGGNLNDGTNFDQWDCQYGESNQLFDFVASDVNKDLLSSWISISNRRAYCLSFRGINDRLILNKCLKNFEGQSYKLSQNTDQSFTLSLPNGFVIDNAGAGVFDGNEVNASEKTGADSQKWYVVPVGVNYFSFVNKSSSKCLSANSAGQSNVLVIWTCDISSEDQRFEVTISKVDEVPVNTWVKIVNKNTGKCVKSLRFKNRVSNVACSDDDSSSAWRLTQREDGTYKIQNFAGTSMLTISDGNDAFVTSEIPWNSQDRWYILPNSPGYYGLLNFSNRRCLDLATSENNNKDNSALQLWDCNMGGNDNQAFALLPMTIKEIPTDWVQIISKATNNCLKFNGETNQLSDGNCCTDKNSTYWKLVKNDNVTYRIVSYNGSTTVVDLKSNWFADGTSIQTNSWNGTDAQRWILSPVNRDLFHLIHPGHNRCIANKDNKYEFWGCNDSKSFLFSIAPVYDQENPCGVNRV